MFTAFGKVTERLINTPMPKIMSLHRPVIRIVAEQSREVPPEWEALLRRYHPITGIYSHLIFKWEHRIGLTRGERRDRSRWTLWEVQPKAQINGGIRMMLEDCPPRMLPKDQQPGRYHFVDDWQWQYYHDHGGYPRPFWILQGPPGGHPAAYNDLEVAQFKAMGEPHEAPPCGAMVYRPFDMRVIQRIASHDLLVKAQMMVDRLMRESDIRADLRDEADAADLEFRQHFLNWFDGALAPSTDFLTWFSRRTEADRWLRPASKSEVAATLDMKDTFMATGTVPLSHPRL